MAAYGELSMATVTGSSDGKRSRPDGKGDRSRIGGDRDGTIPKGSVGSCGTGRDRSAREASGRGSGSPGEADSENGGRGSTIREAIRQATQLPSGKHPGWLATAVAEAGAR